MVEVSIAAAVAVIAALSRPKALRPKPLRLAPAAARCLDWSAAPREPRKGDIQLNGRQAARGSD